MRWRGTLSRAHPTLGAIVNIDMSALVSAAGVAVTVATVVYKAGQLGSGLQALGERLDHLSAEIKELRTHKDTIDERVSELAQRVALLEGRSQRKTPQSV